MLEYRGKTSQDFALKLKKNTAFHEYSLHNEHIKKFSLKPDRNIRHISIRAKKHAAKGTSVYTHFSECDSAVSNEDFEILDGARNHKLLLEALYIWQQKPLLYMRDEFRSRFLSYVF